MTHPRPLSIGHGKRRAVTKCDHYQADGTSAVIWYNNWTGAKFTRWPLCLRCRRQVAAIGLYRKGRV